MINGTNIAFGPGNYLNTEPIPECLPGSVVNRHDITVSTMLQASALAQGDVVDLCIPSSCTGGIDGIWVYTWSYFQWHQNGIPTTDPTYNIPVCGLGYGVNLEYSDGFCENYGDQMNESWFTPSCDPTLDTIHIKFDKNCLDNLLFQYESLGYYSPFFTSGFPITQSNAVFTVIMKCCNPATGEPTCN